MDLLTSSKYSVFRIYYYVITKHSMAENDLYMSIFFYYV